MLTNFSHYDRKLQRQLRSYCASPPQLLKKPLNKSEPIAYISSPALGDTLISLVTVNNLIRNGYQVDVYGDFVYALRDWFPTMQIYPFFPLEEQKKLAKYTTVLHMHERALSHALAAWHPHSIVLFHEPLFKFLLSEVDMQLVVCQYQLGLSDVVRYNNMQPLLGMVAHKYKDRVMLHPTSSSLLRNWPSQKFMQLAQILKTLGYIPHFIVAGNERNEWTKIVNNEFPISSFASLSAVAICLYESGYFIGNDSGIGHLASNVGLPTVSIIIRQGLAKHWRPSWSPGEVVMPPFWLNPRSIREKFWKQCITVKRVLAGFDRLVTKTLLITPNVAETKVLTVDAHVTNIKKVCVLKK
ncbi:conserved hypothetical protein [Gammaproteobacteria bacterium]